MFRVSFCSTTTGCGRKGQVSGNGASSQFGPYGALKAKLTRIGQNITFQIEVTKNIKDAYKGAIFKACITWYNPKTKRYENVDKDMIIFKNGSPYLGDRSVFKWA